MLVRMARGNAGSDCRARSGGGSASVLLNYRGGICSHGLSWQRCSWACQLMQWELKLKGELGQLAYPPEEPV